jgi:hypothetical protein
MNTIPFVDDKLTNIENFKEYIPKFYRKIIDFSKVARYKINT